MMVACPACEHRYDVTGRVHGEAFRCRCGAMIRLASPPRTAEHLACPACGGQVDPTASACAQCHAALLVKACPRCRSRVFHGHSHCPACSAELALAAGDSAVHGERRCPRCAGTLQARRIDDIVIDECAGCRGVFLDHTAIKRVIVDRSATRAEALLQALPRAPIHPMPGAGQKMYLPCPICHVVMNRRLFAAGTGVIIDVCRTHGTFFDAGELPEIIELVMTGGLDGPPHKPIDPARDATHGLSQVLPAQLPVARVVHDPSRPRTATDALIELLASIFD